MEKTIELISGKLNNVEKIIDNNAKVLQGTMEVVDHNADVCNDFMSKMAKTLKSQAKLNRLMFVGLIAGGYILYKQNKEIQELKAKNEVQEQEEK